jgi:gliding motility-associated-like protein
VKQKQCYLLVILALAGSVALGQPYPSRLGRFQVDQKKGCAPFIVTLTNLLPGDCTPGKPCVMDWGDGTPQQQNIFTHTYSTSNTNAYPLKVIYQSIGQDDISIKADDNPQPNFEIYACAGAKATIRVIDSNYDQYVIDYNNDGTPESILPYSNNITAPPYTYAPPGTYTTSVRGRRLNSADNCTAKTQPFTTLAALPTPVMNKLTSVDAATVKLDFTTAVNVEYKMEIATNSATAFQLYQTLYGVNTLTIPNLKLDLNYYCFRLNAFDPCSNGSTYSNVVCSPKFSATAQSDVNVLTTTTGATGTVLNYSILRNGNNYVTTGSSTFNDTDIVCKTDYCYQVIINYLGGAKSTSLPKCVTAFSGKVPTAINDISAVVGASGAADLSWTQDPLFTAPQYNIFRSSSGGLFDFVTTTATTKYTDPLYTTQGGYCYQVNYTDKCGNNSAKGTTACPVRLSGSLDKSNAASLVWSSYKGWQAGVKDYVLEKYNSQGTLIKSVTLSDTTYLDDVPDLANQLVRYIVRAEPNTGTLTASVSNVQEFTKNINLYYPTAFTPNNDNLNDGFIVSGQYIVKMSLKVFDRWGSLLFATDSKDVPWDGRREGKLMTPSVYIWKAEFTDLAGRSFTQEGTVALIQN